MQNLADAISKLGQVQLELVTQGIKSSIAVFEPLSKASIELTANALTSFNQILQNFSASISPKQ
ncbi:MAG: chlorosome envelope protein B [Chlorobiaceae bacterium]|nr:chlorosome envelope protein B [Chlorobiaceae bacterium]